jgi:hypothetical protein
MPDEFARYWVLEGLAGSISPIAATVPDSVSTPVSAEKILIIGSSRLQSSR